ncbi:hypothetical protein WA026_007195 [Henosepilachna vigintioctopunctata]|uniref:Post-GPI attachment to proteins factor 3 n=1 Tax=Henosepilachna vigintioctopunctata TaxID=420089 RepID=A0AAW1V2B5_9CUCU
MYVEFLSKYILLFQVLKIVDASLGDQLESYRVCLYDCVNKDCDTDGYSNLKNEDYFSLSSFFKWPCFGECKYICMWDTVNEFENAGMSIPQFYGKWPFVRYLGLQEPASTVFSLINLILHLKWLRKFRTKVPNDCPLYGLWHIFAIVCVHAWFWSVVFHARDTSLTEFMDYAGAFSIVLVHCYVMVIRLTLKFGRFCCMLISLLFLMFYIKHALYLYWASRIDYKYNMSLNLSIAIFTITTWLIWAYWNRSNQPYVTNCVIYVILTSLVALLEIIDRPPLFYIFDSHSIWHFSTTFLIGTFYKFAMSDCYYLRQKKIEETQFQIIKKLL